jgi:hypothetical protein
MFWWEMCGEERDLAVSGNAVYGGGGPRAAAAVVVVTAELRGGTTGGVNANDVKRKGPLGKAAAVVVEDARLRVWVLWPADDDARLRTGGGLILLRG